jgi:hypothetical protein
MLLTAQVDEHGGNAHGATAEALRVFVQVQIVPVRSVLQVCTGGGGSTCSTKSRDDVPSGQAPCMRAWRGFTGCQLSRQERQQCGSGSCMAGRSGTEGSCTHGLVVAVPQHLHIFCTAGNHEEAGRPALSAAAPRTPAQQQGPTADAAVPRQRWWADWLASRPFPATSAQAPSQDADRRPHTHTIPRAPAFSTGRCVQLATRCSMAHTASS